MATRIYNYKDVDMLLASKTISQSLTEYIADLSMVRSTWTVEFATSLSEKIDNAIETHLGIDKKKELRNATANLKAIQTPAMRDLSFIKTQIDVDFGAKAKEILTNLGFTTSLRKAQSGSQEALIQLLYSFKSSITEELKTTMVSKGTNPALIERVISYASLLLDSNVTQESLKESTKAISEDAVNAFNEIYTEISGICKIASTYYQYEPLKKEQFTFSKVISNMGQTKRAVQQPAT